MPHDAALLVRSTLAIEEADQRRCEELLRVGSRSFSAAARLLPARVRAPVTAFYAFCRVADDAIDLSEDPTAASRVVTLTQLIDSGGTANGGDDTASLSVASSPTFCWVNP